MTGVVHVRSADIPRLQEPDNDLSLQLLVHRG